MDRDFEPFASLLLGENNSPVPNVLRPPKDYVAAPLARIDHKIEGEPRLRSHCMALLEFLDFLRLPLMEAFAVQRRQIGYFCGRVTLGEFIEDREAIELAKRFDDHIRGGRRFSFRVAPLQNVPTLQAFRRFIAVLLAKPVEEQSAHIARSRGKPLIFRRPIISDAKRVKRPLCRILDPARRDARLLLAVARGLIVRPKLIGKERTAKANFSNARLAEINAFVAVPVMIDRDIGRFLYAACSSHGFAS